MSKRQHAGWATAARNDPREYTAAGRQASLQRFYKDIPQDLPEEERERRARAAKSLYFSQMSYKRRSIRNGKGR